MMGERSSRQYQLAVGSLFQGSSFELQYSMIPTFHYSSLSFYMCSRSTAVDLSIPSTDVILGPFISGICENAGGLAELNHIAQQHVARII